MVRFHLTSDPAIFYRTSPGVHFPTNDIVRRVTKGYSLLDLVVLVSVGRDLNHSISLCPVICSTESSFAAPTVPRFSYEQPRAYLSYCAEHKKEFALHISSTPLLLIRVPQLLQSCPAAMPSFHPNA